MLMHRHVRKHPDGRRSPVMDRMAYVFAIAAPLFTIPQILDIWQNGSSAGVSLLSWGAYEVCTVFWFSYAWYHRDRPLIVTHGLWMVMQGAVVLGLLIYR